MEDEPALPLVDPLPVVDEPELADLEVPPVLSLSELPPALLPLEEEKSEDDCPVTSPDFLLSEDLFSELLFWFWSLSDFDSFLSFVAIKI